ncbi:MAG: phosphate signaling complex protein PhoU [Phycisphaeraceae bacterium]|nr:phosphate signaling complex protein PhoU [Phycisphaerales bacterium]MCB9860355.1 phosphate signaling complex protein PhoU [Phycisphaeraceae bacterium]
MNDIEHHPSRYTFDQRLATLKRRLVLEAGQAIKMLEDALSALFISDREAAMAVRKADDVIDEEEVQIELECFRLLAMEQPVARDFRAVTFVLKANADIERVADHASSIAKICRKIQSDHNPVWPTALKELGVRVPLQCHDALRAIQMEDTALAEGVISTDDVIDELEKQLFEETVDMMRTEDNTEALGMQINRIGRELERAADLMTDIARDIIYLNTGHIVRHSRRTS